MWWVRKSESRNKRWRHRSESECARACAAKRGGGAGASVSVGAHVRIVCVKSVRNDTPRVGVLMDGIQDKVKASWWPETRSAQVRAAAVG